jgi:hypothetical protein
VSEERPAVPEGFKIESLKNVKERAAFVSTYGADAYARLASARDEAKAKARVEANHEQQAAFYKWGQKK